MVPTRLLEIRRQDESWKLRLRCDLSERRPYTALSYCWGPQYLMTAKTTEANISAWIDDLPWVLLPRTIQDAIIVTYELGIQFLWVDSLCIVQDNRADVTREISRMPLIYGQAEVTIAASRAEHVQEGFLNAGFNLWSEERSFQLAFRSTSGQLGSIRLFEDYEDLKIEPLDLRGWSMQERLLSRRVVEFGSRQTRVSCRKLPRGRSDGWTARAEWVPGRLEYLPKLVVFPTGIARFSLDPKSRDLKLLESWHSVIYHYTRRDLTFESDRLLAISGIADKFSSVLPNEYRAGLWRFRLAHELLWESRSYEERPQRYQAPSWSWASINGPVIYAAETSELRPAIEIIDVTVDLASAVAPFGAVTSGSLTVKGRLRPAQWRRGNPSDGERLRLLGAEGRRGILAFSVVSDAVEEFSDLEWVTVFLLVVVSKRSPHPDTYYGLMLRYRGNKTYSRLGMFSFPADDRDVVNNEERAGEYSDHCNWFNSCKEIIITLT
jgi:hypothetical protein